MQAPERIAQEVPRSKQVDKEEIFRQVYKFCANLYNLYKNNI